MNGVEGDLMEQKSRYKAQITDEETKLRWLITRQPSSVELRYYLLFLLVANERYVKASKECEQILENHPDDFIAQVWMGVLRRQQIVAHVRPSLRRRHQTVRSRVWGHVCRHSD